MDLKETIYLKKKIIKIFLSWKSYYSYYQFEVTLLDKGNIGN